MSNLNTIPNWEGEIKEYWAVANAGYEFDLYGRAKIITLKLLRLYDANGDLIDDDTTAELETRVCEQIEFEWENK